MTQNTLPKPSLYIDIDGVLLANEHHLAEGAADFIKYIADNFEVFWLTTHCMDGDPAWAIEYVNRASDEDISPWLKKFKPTTWETNKTEAITMTAPFLWFDDDCLDDERAALKAANVEDSWIEVDLFKKQDQLVHELITLRSLNNYNTPLPNTIYEYITTSGFIVLAGQSGSGKSNLVTSYLNYMAAAYSPSEWGVVALDVTCVDYEREQDNPYLIARSQNMLDDSAMQLLQRMAYISVDRALRKKDNLPKLITVHINECDLAIEDMRQFIDYVNKIGTAHAMKAGVQVIYETSRIDEQTLPPELLNSANLRLLQPVTSEEAAEYVTGRKSLQAHTVGETIVLKKYFYTNLVRTFPPISPTTIKQPFTL